MSLSQFGLLDAIGEKSATVNGTFISLRLEQGFVKLEFLEIL